MNDLEKKLKESNTRTLIELQMFYLDHYKLFQEHEISKEWVTNYFFTRVHPVYREYENGKN